MPAVRFGCTGFRFGVSVGGGGDERGDLERGPAAASGERPGGDLGESVSGLFEGLRGGPVVNDLKCLPVERAGLVDRPPDLVRRVAVPVRVGDDRAARACRVVPGRPGGELAGGGPVHLSPAPGRAFDFRPVDPAGDGRRAEVVRVPAPQDEQVRDRSCSLERAGGEPDRAKELGVGRE